MNKNKQRYQIPKFQQFQNGENHGLGCLEIPNIPDSKKFQNIPKLPKIQNSKMERTMFGIT